MAWGDLLETVEYNSAGDASPDVAFADLTDGNLIVSVVYVGDGPLAPAGDLLEAVENLDAGQDDSLAIGYRVAQSGDGLTWGWTQPSADQAALINREFEGPWDASPLDQTDTTAFADSQSSMAAGPTATTAQNDELAVAAWASRRVIGLEDGFTVTSVDNDFANLVSEANGASGVSFKGVATATKILTATGTPTVTGTFSATTGRAGACIATFKKQAEAGGAELGRASGLTLLGIGG